jgi:two-component system, NarL family, captular synthesis response regulator RcsB
MPRGLRILLADDHPLLLAGINAIFQRSDLASHIAQAANASAIVAHLETHVCDLLITDYSMPDPHYGDGLQMLGFLRRRFPELRIVVLTLIDNPALLRSIIRLGIYAIVSKKDAATLILSATQAAAQGMPYKSPTIAAALATATALQAPHGTARLSKRESEVLRLYAEGLSVTEISLRLNRSVKTVSGQKNSAFDKLGIEHDAALFRYAFDSGLCTSSRPIAAKLPSAFRPNSKL